MYNPSNHPQVLFPLQKCYQNVMDEDDDFFDDFPEVSIFTIVSYMSLDAYIDFFKLYELQLRHPENEVESPIDINKTNLDGNSLLHQIFINFRKNKEVAFKMVKIALAHGAQCNIFNKEKMTPLQLAIQRGYIEIIQFCHEYNEENRDKYSGKDRKRFLFNFNKRSGWRLNTPLHIAISYGNISFLEYVRKFQEQINMFVENTLNKKAKSYSFQSMIMLKCYRKQEMQELAYQLRGMDAASQNINRNFELVEKQSQLQTQKILIRYQQISMDSHYNSVENMPSSPKNEFSCSDEDTLLESDEEKEELKINQFKKIIETRHRELLYKHPLKKNKNKVVMGFMKSKKDVEHVMEQDQVVELIMMIRNGKMERGVGILSRKVRQEEMGVSERLKYLCMCRLVVHERSEGSRLVFYVPNDIELKMSVFSGVEREAQVEWLRRAVTQLEREAVRENSLKVEISLNQLQLQTANCRHQQQQGRQLNDFDLVSHARSVEQFHGLLLPRLVQVGNIIRYKEKLKVSSTRCTLLDYEVTQQRLFHFSRLRPHA